MSVFPDALNYMEASQSYGASIVAALSAGQHFSHFNIGPIYWLVKEPVITRQFEWCILMTGLWFRINKTKQDGTETCIQTHWSDFCVTSATEQNWKKRSFPNRPHQPLIDYYLLFVGTVILVFI